MITPRVTLSFDAADYARLYLADRARGWFASHSGIG
jgi:hypothetical protein